MSQNLLVKGGLWVAYGAITTRILALAGNLLLARLLLPSDFGVIGTAYIFWSFVNLFTQNTTASFIVYKGIDDERYLNTTHTISLLVGLGFSVSLVALAPLAANFFDQPNLVWILLAFAGNLLWASARAAHVGVMTRRMQYRELTNSTLVASITRLLCTAVAALLGLSYWSFVVGDTVFWILEYVLKRHQSGHRFQLKIDGNARAEILSYYLGIAGSSTGSYVNSNLDNVVVAKLLGSTSLGYYSFAYQLTMALTMILNQITAQMGLSVFAQLQDEQQRKDVLAKVVKQAAFVTAPLYALFFVIVDKRVIALVFGSQWTPIVTVIPWLLIFAYSRVINKCLGSMFYAKGRPGIDAKFNLYSAPVAALSFIIGAWTGGIVGVSIAVGLVLGVFYTVCYWWVCCSALGWPVMKFLAPCLTPSLITLLSIGITLGMPTILKPFFMLLIYLGCTRILAPDQFLEYQKRLSQFTKRLEILCSRK